MVKNRVLLYVNCSMLSFVLDCIGKLYATDVFHAVDVNTRTN